MLMTSFQRIPLHNSLTMSNNDATNMTHLYPVKELQSQLPVTSLR